MNLPALIAVAQGQQPADLLLANVQLLNVLSGEIYPAHIAVFEGVIAGLEELPAKQVIDARGAFAAPGLIDGHVHLESSLLTPAQFARAVVPHGTTTVVADPHEIANVLGLAGLDYMLTASEHLPLDIFLMLPSCVPATHLESSGAVLTAADLQPYLKHPRILGLAEMMNYPGVLSGDPQVLAKLAMAREKIIDGHAPLLSGSPLSAYCAAGISSDHECSHAAEALEKLRRGMFIMVREGSAARNLRDLLPLVTPYNANHCGFVTDDRHPDMLLNDGHIDAIVRQAIKLGLDPVTAIKMATINTARHFGLRRRGALAPGYQADIVLFDDFERLHVLKVFKRGRLVAENGKMVVEIPAASVQVTNSVNFAPFDVSALRLEARSERVRMIEIVPGQIITKNTLTEAPQRDGLIVSDPARDLLKLIVVERHHATGRIGKGLVKGLGLQRGALASTVAHDSHNIIAAGVTDEDLYQAVQLLKEIGGGQVVVVDGKPLAQLALPVAGLLSDRSLEEVHRQCEQLQHAARQLGCQLPDPFMTLAFLALPVIPELKLTDLGLIDVLQFKPVGVGVE